MWLERFDSVVMLTWSDWRTEPRSNRYHYGSRFARHVPVIFVQPDGTPGLEDETELSNLTVLHVGRSYVREQLGLVRQALQARGLSHPLLWIYNPNYMGLGESFAGAIQIYHATEDYFTDWRPKRLHSRLYRSEVSRMRSRLVEFLAGVDLVVSVTHQLGERLLERSGYRGPMVVLENGCDYAFWAGGAERSEPEAARLAIYQGGINHRVDFVLLDEVLRALPDWEFRFCGPVAPRCEGWEWLQRHANLRYLGELKPGELRRAVHACTVGLIPFVQEPYITKQSLPLKAFEYAACGLPVVTVPIESLAPYHGLFRFASSAAEFIKAIPEEGAKRFDAAAVEARMRGARAQDYDDRFAELGRRLASIQKRESRRSLRVRVKALQFDLDARWNQLLERMPLP